MGERFWYRLFGATIALGLLFFTAITSEQASAAQSRAKGAQASHRNCPLGEAKAKALASKVSVSIDAPAQITLLDTFEITVAVSPERGDDGANRGIVAITLGLSAAAGVETVPGHVDIFEPGARLEKGHTEVGFGVRIFEGMRRAIVRVDPMTVRKDAEIKIKVRAWAAGPLQLKWTLSGSAIGCPARQFAPVQQRTIEVISDPQEQALGVSGSCPDEKSALKSLADKVRVSFQGARTLNVGDEVTVTWTRGEIRFLHGRPVYLVFSVPEGVRFAGRDLMVPPPKARTPANIGFDGERLRVFVPLHMIGTPQASAFKIKPYEIGTLTVDHAIVAKTGCGEHVLIQGTRQEYEVEPGRQEIVIQDFFSLEKPKKVITSDSGRFRLEVYQRHYKVFDITSAGRGAKIIERSGRNPNFSPTGRFVVAHSENSDENTGGKMEMFDLIAGRDVDFRLRGPILAWTLQDALLIEGT